MLLECIKLTFRLVASAIRPATLAQVQNLKIVHNICLNKLGIFQTKYNAELNTLLIIQQIIVDHVVHLLAIAIPAFTMATVQVVSTHVSLLTKLIVIVVLYADLT